MMAVPDDWKQSLLPSTLLVLLFLTMLSAVAGGFLRIDLGRMVLFSELLLVLLLVAGTVLGAAVAADDDEDDGGAVVVMLLCSYR
jgi:TRAP-type C4-dicarboxylate transport system permease small subunit